VLPEVAEAPPGTIFLGHQKVGPHTYFSPYTGSDGENYFYPLLGAPAELAYCYENDIVAMKVNENYLFNSVSLSNLPKIEKLSTVLETMDRNPPNHRIAQQYSILVDWNIGSPVPCGAVNFFKLADPAMLRSNQIIVQDVCPARISVKMYAKIEEIEWANNYYVTLTYHRGIPEVFIFGDNTYGDCCHPHCENGYHPCLGETMHVVSYKYTEQRFEEAFLLIKNFLTTWNPDDCYRSAEGWEVAHNRYIEGEAPAVAEEPIPTPSPLNREEWAIPAPTWSWSGSTTTSDWNISNTGTTDNTPLPVFTPRLDWPEDGEDNDEEYEDE